MTLPPQGRPIDVIGEETGVPGSTDFFLFANETDGITKKGLISDLPTAAGATQNLFERIVGNTGSTIVADTPADTLTIIGDDGITTETDPTTDTLTIKALPGIVSSLILRNEGGVVVDNSGNIILLEVRTC